VRRALTFARAACRDERGKPSAARTYLAPFILVALILVVLDASGIIDLAPQAYGFFRDVIAVLGSWAGLPRAFSALRSPLPTGLPPLDGRHD